MAAVANFGLRRTHSIIVQTEQAFLVALRPAKKEQRVSRMARSQLSAAET